MLYFVMSLRSAMWRNVGIERDGGSLGDALEMIDFWGRYCLDKTFDDPEEGRTLDQRVGAENSQAGRMCSHQ